MEPIQNADRRPILYESPIFLALLSAVKSINQSNPKQEYKFSGKELQKHRGLFTILASCFILQCQ